MALTNAERQAALKARREEMTRMLAEQNAALLAENAELRAEVATLREKAHRLEVASLKAQLKQAAEAKTSQRTEADKPPAGHEPEKPQTRATKSATKRTAKP
jgi:predicted nuclease with TOPRIM domain